MNEKKVRERQVLEHFLRLTGIQTIAIEESDPPDFRLRLADRVVAVEITSYIRGRSSHGSPQRAQHRFIDSVLDQAHALFESRNPGEPLWVTVDPEPGKASATRGQLAHLLRDAVEDCLRTGGIPERASHCR